MNQRIPYLIGNKKGRDIQNWPTRSLADVTDWIGDADRMDRIYPVDISWDQMIALSWRVKKWKLTGSFNVAVNSEGFYTIGAATWAVTLDLGYIHASRFDYAALDTKEKQLLEGVYGPSWGRSNRELELVNGGIIIPSAATDFPVMEAVTTYETRPTFESSFAANVEAGMIELLRGNYVIFNPDNPSTPFSPYINFDLQVADAHALAELVTSRAGLSRASDSSGNVFTLGHHRTWVAGPVSALVVKPIVAADFNVPLSAKYTDLYDAIPPGFANTLDFVSASGGLTLEAVEFWPYNNSEGNPVYDTTNGSVINDPFS